MLTTIIPALFLQAFPAVLVQVLLVLLVVGVILWGVSQLPMDAAIRQLIRVVVIVIMAIWLIYLIFGMFGPAAVYPFRK